MWPTARRRSRLLPFLLLACFSLHGQGGDASERETRKLLSKTVPVEEGDRCVVCNRPLGPADKVYLVAGRRVGVMKEMEKEFFADASSYLARLQPQSGLFSSEKNPAKSGVSNSWLYLGVYVILGLAFSALSAHRAMNAGQPVFRWFTAGLFLNVLAYLALLVRTTQDSRAEQRYAGAVKIPTTTEPVACPECDSLNHPSARSCLKCGAQLTPSAISEVTSLDSTANQ